MERKSTSREGPCLSRLSIRLRATSSSTVYVRAGTGFTANGVGQTFSFQTPDIGHGRISRLGNENDFYFETGPIWDHMLGDDPDVSGCQGQDQHSNVQRTTDKQTSFSQT